MEKTDSYLLLLAGLLVIALIAVELIPIPEPVSMQQPGLARRAATQTTGFRPPSLNNGMVASLFIMPTSTLATVTIS